MSIAKQIIKKKLLDFKNKFKSCDFLLKLLFLNKKTNNNSAININEKKDNFFLNLIVALFCAGLIRSFIFEPFHIPSGSMKPTLIAGDFIFVKKYSYGYSHYSFPFSINFFSGRIFNKSPKRGDVAVFRYPPDPSINYIKRIIGLPHDRIQIRSGKLYINDEMVIKTIDGKFNDKLYGEDVAFDKFLETLPSGKKFYTLDLVDSPQDNTGIFEVPANHYFVMGDNRDNSQDSRFLDHVGYIPEENLIGEASIIFFSNEDSIWKFWLWADSIRFNRIFKNINNEQ